MKVLIDANIILDVLQRREPHFHDSSLIWKSCETGSMEGYVSSLNSGRMFGADLINKKGAIFTLLFFAICHLTSILYYATFVYRVKIILITILRRDILWVFCQERQQLLQVPGVQC